jgi:hypothetical protein
LSRVQAGFFLVGRFAIPIRIFGMTLTPDDRAAINQRIREIIEQLRAIGLSAEQRDKLNDEWTALERKLADG